jgi:hypothetical protein
LRHAFGVQREVFRLKGRVRLEADDVTTVAQVNERALAGANRAALMAVLVKIDGAEVFTIAAVLPLQIDWGRGQALEIDLAEKVSAILTLDGILPGREEPFFVLGTEYSHFRGSLQRQVTVQVVLGTKHDIDVGGDTDLQMKINGKRLRIR